MIKKITAIGLLALSAVALADTFSLFAPADGLLVGDQDTYVTTSATSTDVRALWAGTCDSSTFLRGDGTCIAPADTAPAGSNTQVQFNNGGAFGASSAFTWNGSTLSATSFTGSGSGLTGIPDGALSSNVPLKNAPGTFSAQLASSVAAAGGNAGFYINSATPAFALRESDAGADEKLWDILANGDILSIRAVNDANSVATDAISFARTGYVITGTTINGGNVTVNAPSSGPTLTVNGSGSHTAIATGKLSIAVDTPFVTGGNIFAANALAIGTTSASTLSLLSNNTTRGTISSAGNWTINAPSSGIPLTVNQATSGQGVQITDGTRSLFLGANSGGPFLATSSGHGFSLYTNGLERIPVSSAGNVTINAPSSGTPLSVLANTGSNDLWADFSDGVSVIRLRKVGGVPSIGTATTHGLQIATDDTSRIAIAAGGNVTINAPSSGNTLALTQGSSDRALTFTDGTVQGTVQAVGGTSVGIGALSAHGVGIYADSGTLRMFIDEGVQIGSPTGADKGAGTLNTAGGIYQNNVPVCLSDGTNCPGGASIRSVSATIMVSGSSCTVLAAFGVSGTCSSAATGIGTITFSSAFSSAPVCTATAESGGPLVIPVLGSNTTTADVNLFDLASDPTDGNANIICVGT